MWWHGGYLTSGSATLAGLAALADIVVSDLAFVWVWWHGGYLTSGSATLAALAALADIVVPG